MRTIILLLLSLNLSAQSWNQRQTTIDNNCGGFYEYLPLGYNNKQTYPLLVFLHGLGETGNGKSDLYKLTWTGLPALIQNNGFPASFTVANKTFSFIVIAPQFVNWPGAESVAAVVAYAQANYAVDGSRIYVTGLSMGGGATWDYAGVTASKLAAIVPICGATWPDPVKITSMVKANLPVLATHNADDGTVSVTNTLGFIDGMNNEGASPKAEKVIWPSGGHDAWTRTYNPATTLVNGLNMYQWMLQYSRGAVAPPPVDTTFKVYPNPAKNSVTVVYNPKISGEIKLISVTGVVIRSWRSTGSIQTLSLKGISRGWYIIQLNELHKKMLIQ